MSAQADPRTFPHGSTGPDNAVTATTAAVHGLNLGRSSQQKDQVLYGDGLAETPAATTENHHATDSSRTLEPVKTNAIGLTLPYSAADGLIKTPLGKPLERSKPTKAADLTSEHTQKYNTLLQSVLKWTDIPGTTKKEATLQKLTEHERMFLTRDCLLRYLRATKWNVVQAETRLRDTLVWRRDYGTDRFTADYISIENETGKQVILGWDNDGRPCLYLRPSKQNTEKTDRQIEHLVYMLERTIDLMPPGQERCALLINFQETKSGQGASIAQGKQTLSILQNHYPERLGRALVTNVPWMIWGFFKLITPFIDPLTKEKIKFNEPMSNFVPKEQLLQEAGGQVKFEYDHSSYWPALTKLCEAKRNAYQERWERGGKRIGEYELYLRGGEQKSLAEIEKATAQA